MKPLFSSDIGDWIVTRKGSVKGVRIQVKCAYSCATGLPIISLRSSNRGRYRGGSFDFIVGYDLISDTAYVFTEQEVRHLHASVSASMSSEEAWHKLDSFPW